jgi:hypothetical protein
MSFILMLQDQLTKTLDLEVIVLKVQEQLTKTLDLEVIALKVPLSNYQLS